MIDTSKYPAVLTYESHGQRRTIAFPSSDIDVHTTADLFVGMISSTGYYPGQLEDAIIDRINDRGVHYGLARPDSRSYDPSFPFAMKVWLGYDRGCTTLWWPEEMEDEYVMPCLNAYFGSFEKFEWLGPGVPVEDALAFADWVASNYSRIASSRGAYYLSKDGDDTTFDIEELHRIFNLQED